MDLRRGKEDTVSALHSAANAARELGGSLRTFSEGADHGATYTLELPAQRRKK
jgi:hypothetical protein